MKTATVNQNQYFPALTGVRALAAYLVFVHHVLPGRGILPEPIIQSMHAGQMGVSIFFVLSGFLISYRYSEALPAGNISFRNYFLRRVARIYPLYLVLSIIVLLWQKNFDPWHWFLNLSLLKGFFAFERLTGIAQGWSLTVEECFYLGAPLLFLVFRKLKIWSVLLILLAGLSIVFLAQLGEPKSFMVNANFMLKCTLFGRCFEFYCGYLLARKMQKNAINKSLENNGSTFTIAGGLCLLLFYGVFSWLNGKMLPVLGGIEIINLVNNFVLPIGIVLWFYGLLTERTSLSRILSSKLAQVLGRSSYAFYLIHLGLVYEVFYFHVTDNKSLIFLILNVISIGLYYLFEEPVNRFILRKWQTRKTGILTAV
ncbi:acyltransferase family protein [Adhaeribacter soli]|uniref:Acyltransferase n=1 Tax=Adhaeribacter soli TaxID=2607655 RepID=A0A5N1IWL3_9BACT|nr:acyltransferase [Adhaeribacter soli]KAA9338905.1 acyltransferase [Adhaeribacter soli]